MGTIRCASSIPLNENQGTIPDVSGALLDWLQTITFTNIVKSVVLFQNVETPTSVTFEGTWIAFSGQQLQKMERGQRSWKWYTCCSLTQLPLSVDDVVTYLGTQFRVDYVGDYNQYGFYQYHMVNDYTGAGP